MFVFTFVLLLHNTSVERKTLTKNSRTISQRSPTPGNALCTTRETGKRTLHNLVENPGIDPGTSHTFQQIMRNSQTIFQFAQW